MKLIFKISLKVRRATFKLGNVILNTNFISIRVYFYENQAEAPVIQQNYHLIYS